MSHMLGVRPFRKRHYRTLSLLCEDDPLSDVQLKAYQTKLQEYQTFLDSVVRLALCGNVCVTEEAVTIGEHGLLTGESLNALQHAGAISVYNTLQQNNWEFPVPEDCEVAVIKSHTPIPDEFLDSEKPIRSDWPSVHISECFIEGEKAKLHGSVRPLRTFLPPTVVFRNAADVDEDITEPELSSPPHTEADAYTELFESSKGIMVKKMGKDGRGVEYIPLEEYYFGCEDGNHDYCEEKGDFRFKCAVCQRIFYSNVKLMSHILGHVDETSQAGLNLTDTTQCHLCDAVFPSPAELRSHVDQGHAGASVDSQTSISTGGHFIAQTASQLLMQHRLDDSTSTQETTPTSSLMRTATAKLWNCRICGKEAGTEIALAHHLQSTHRQREMPYVCRLCLFRSSVLADILDHFKKVHDNSNHLLCTYCLRIFTPPDARASQHSSVLSTTAVNPSIGQTQVYLQHLRMHQVRHQLRRCPSCKLNFTNKSDYQVHRRLDHKGVRGGATSKLDESRPDAFELDQGHMFSEDVSDQPVQYMKEAHPHVTLMNAPEASRIKSLTSIHLPEDTDQMNCLECDQSLGSAQHKKYLSCTMCRFGTCCAVGYNRHVSHVHVYISGAGQIEPDSSTPMVRPVFFEWIADEVRAIDIVNDGNIAKEVSLTDVAEIAAPHPPVMQQSVTAQSAVCISVAPEPVVDGSAPPSNIIPASEKLDKVVPLSLDPDNFHSSTLALALSKDLVEPIVTDSQPVGDALEVSQSFTMDNVDEPDISDLLAPETDISVGQNVDTEPTNYSLVPTQLSPPASPGAIHESVSATTETDRNTVRLSPSYDRLEMVRKYMALQLNARRLACIHCAITNLNGNSLARHLVEECGTSTATLNPNPELVKARLELEEQQRLRRDQLMEQSETDILFESTELHNSAPDMPVHIAVDGCGQEVATTEGGEMLMVNVAPDQLASYGLMHSAMQMDQPMVDHEQMGGTTIDVTDATGTVVQQFLIPDDLQLEEGQTLVVIHDDNGQPQLAIVNQADLVDPNNPQMLIQTDEDETNMLLYSNTVDDQMQVVDGVMVGQGEEDEKENHQFSL